MKYQTATAITMMRRISHHATLVVVPGAAHGMNYSHPDLLAAQILQFVGVPGQ
jgi:pimeloyl-ACP methyl ester carboxylesterase